MDVIADLASYPQWTSGIDAVEIHGSDEAGRPLSATFRGSVGPVKDSYTVAYDWSDAEVRWSLTKGEALKDLQGVYICTGRGDGSTLVQYRLELDLAIPMIGMLRRRGEKAVVESALKGLKRRVEG
jgi:ribosome-associated toxin RatA of RatAB toxin-antitoxin module